MDRIKQIETYIDYNMALVPLPPGQKYPNAKDWGNHCLTTAKEVRDFYSTHEGWGVGVSLGASKLCSLDIDCMDSFKIICIEMGIDVEALNTYPIIKGSSKGARLLFSVPDGVEIKYQKLNWRTSEDKSFTVFELRTADDTKQRQDVLPPSIHPDTHKPYVWLKELGEVIEQPPVWLLELWKNWGKFKPQLVSIDPNARKITQQPQAVTLPQGKEGDIFQAWNEAHSLRATLENYGYKQSGKDRFISPHSTTGLAGVVMFDEMSCWIHHASDPLCSDDTGKPVNAFDLFCEFEHRGNVASAAQQAREFLGMPPKVVELDLSALLSKHKAKTEGQQASDQKQAEQAVPVKDEWLISANDFLTDFKPISWLIKGVLPKSSTAMLFGPSGVGKSFLLIDWMMHIATARPCWNGKKVKSGQVVYLAGEGHHGIKGRIKAWMQENGQEVDDIKLHISKSACDINTRQGITKVMQELENLNEPPALVVIDTVNRFLDGDENNSQDVRNMMNACDVIRQEYPDCTNVLVHHTGVSGEAQKRARGSSAWKAAMDVEFCISPQDGAVELSQLKAKDGRAMDPWCFELKEIPLDGMHDEDGDQVTSAVISPTEAEDKPKKDSISDKHMREFVNAFWFIGAEFMGGKAYISRAGLIRYYTGAMALSESAARKRIAPGDTKRTIGHLLNACLISPEDHGWVVNDQTLNASLTIQHNFKANSGE